MARALDWEKDRQRQLAKRAIAQKIEYQRRKRAARAPQKTPAHRSKQADRELAAEIGRLYQDERGRIESKGAWHIQCDECGKDFQVKAALCAALEARFDCPDCGGVHQLEEEDLKLPWD